MLTKVFYFVSITTLFAGTVVAPNSVHFYRYDLPTPSCAADRFKGELNAGTKLTGFYHRVETDPAGRLISSALMREGKAVGGYTIRYPGKSHDMIEWTLLRRGAPIRIQKCVRDANGKVVRVEIRNPAGVLIEIQRISPAYSPGSPGRESWIGYTLDGNIKERETDFFNANGVLTMFQAEFAGDGNFHESTFDPDTGFVQRRQLFELGTHKLLRTDKYTYDHSGDRIRADVFDAKGVPYGRMEYTADLETKRAYKRADGTAETYHYGYDERRLLRDATLSVNGNLICKFVYVRDKKGTLSNTEVRGTDGSLWAVYPNREIQEVSRDGHDSSDKNSKIFHHGNWW